MASTNPKIRNLERQIGELERAPLLHKATIAREVAVASVELLSELEVRLAAVEAVAHKPVPVLDADELERRIKALELSVGLDAAPVPRPARGVVR